MSEPAPESAVPTSTDEPTEPAPRAVSAAHRWLQVASLAPLVIGVIAYFTHPPLRASLDEGIGAMARGDLAALRVWGQSLGPWGWVGTSVLMIVQAIAAPIPAVLVTATNSWLYGWVLGGALSIVAATVAAGICYAIGQLFGEPVVARLISAKALARGDRIIAEHGVTAVLVARLVPFVPFDPISYVAGVGRMPFWRFMAATLVGQIPAGMTYAYLATYADKPSGLLVVGPSAVLGLIVVGLAARRALLPPDRAASSDDAASS